MRARGVLFGLVACLTIVPGLARADHRLQVPVSQYPWSVVARVTFGHGWCSAVMIGPKLAVTAAHCLWNKVTGRRMEARALSVVVGWDRGIPVDGSGVADVVVSPDWPTGAPAHYGPAEAAHDWMLLALDKPLGDRVGWVGLAASAQPGLEVTAIGYGEDRKHITTAHVGCHLLRKQAAGVWLHDCDAVHGDSGGPVLRMDKDQPVLVAVNVARFGLDQGGSVGGAVGVEDFAAQARHMGASSHGSAAPK